MRALDDCVVCFPPQIDTLTEKIIGAAMAVHTELGPGLLESVYRECMEFELSALNLRVTVEQRVNLVYKGRPLATFLKVDLIVEGFVVVELKAVDRLHPIYLAQVITELKLTGCPVGLLINFNAPSIRAGLKRLEHPELYSRRTS